jgi:hypothetical protein
VAGYALAVWIAIGSVFVVGGERENPDILLPVSLLAGSGLTAAAFAVLTRMGIIDASIAAIATIGLVVLVVRRRIVRNLIAAALSDYSQAFANSGLLRVASVPVALLLWVYAIAPPRDGDVMRYHLAHIRQIISDGRWLTIRDYHYAFPFGWTLNYLPFERLNLPQAAALVNVGLWIVLIAGILKAASWTRRPQTAELAGIVLLLHPFVLRIFASAMADAYAVFAIYAIALMLSQLDARSPRQAILLGFVCWIGIQSRYQLVAWGMAGTIIFAWYAATQKGRGTIYFALGAVAAFGLSTPFYIANLVGSGNPVWPLLIPSLNGTAAYADHVAYEYTATMTGLRNVSYVADRIGDLVTTPSLVPIALVLLLLVPAGIWLRDSRYRRVAIFGTLFLAFWVLMEPRLFPRHVLMLAPCGALVAMGLIDRFSSRDRLMKIAHWILVPAVILAIAVSALFSWDYLRYDATGDTAAYHRYTWYYPVYDWANHNTPENARFLVVTYSGHSYYLDRRYRRADPWLSGVVDWSHVSSPEALASILHGGGYDYVIYDDRDWRQFYGGPAMTSAVRSAIANGLLVPVHESRERLYTSRVMRQYDESDVYVLKVR